MKKILTYPRNARLQLTLDSSEIYPDDPGNGTPCVVTYTDAGGTEYSATINCALGEGELTSFNDRVIKLDDRMLDWLVEDEDVEREVNAMYDAGHNGNW